MDQIDSDGLRAFRSELMAATPAEVVPTTPAPSEIVAAMPAPAEAWVTKVRARIKPGQLLRVTGNFGRFSGRASGIDEQGLSGLQQDLAFDSTLPLPSEPLSWTKINRVERRGNNSGRFALVGGVALGLAIGSAFAMLAGSDFGLSPSTASFEDHAKGFFVGSVVGGLAGAGLGALIGLPVPRWTLVYRKPR